MNNVKEMSDEQLKAELLTNDFHGKSFKELCLNELIGREVICSAMDSNNIKKYL